MTKAARGACGEPGGRDLQKFLAESLSAARVRTDQLSARLRRTTLRERLLLGGLVMVGLIYAPVAAFEWRAAREDLYIDAVTERAAARLSRDSARRIAATAANSAARRDMDQWGFGASNIPIAQVLIERRLLDAATEAGLTNVRITMSDDVEPIGSVNWLAGEVQADLVWKGVFGMLDTLGGWPEGFRVTDFHYQMRPTSPGAVHVPGGPPIGSVRIGLSFPVNVPTAGAGETDGATGTAGA